MPSDDLEKKYRLVVFMDKSCGFKFLTRSCVETNDTINFEGYGELPLERVEISSKSHPYYTGEKANYSNISNVDRFYKKYKKIEN